MLGASVVYKFLETHFIASLMKLDQVYNINGGFVSQI